MASRGGASSRSKKGSNPYPLIPERNRYVFNFKRIQMKFEELKNACKRRKLNIPETKYPTHKLVHLLSTLAQRSDKKDTWDDKCEEILATQLPLREHHRALISHSVMVTVIGAIAARALEEATWRNCSRPLDLLADRYYIRDILCHDSSKTSAVEAAAYSGIMAVHMELKEIGDGVNAQAATAHRDVDIPQVLTSMANVGFKHHYEHNKHHVEYYNGEEMSDMSVIEAIVDGLACVFERSKDHKNVADWIGMYRTDKFRNHKRNKALADNVLKILAQYVTGYDYEQLMQLRGVLFNVVGESTPWSYVKMDACCACCRRKRRQFPRPKLVFPRNVSV